jgi:hypothetical protein
LFLDFLDCGVVGDDNADDFSLPIYVSVYFDKRYASAQDGTRHVSLFFQELERTLFRISFEYAAALTTD